MSKPVIKRHGSEFAVFEDGEVAARGDLQFCKNIVVSAAEQGWSASDYASWLQSEMDNDESLRYAEFGSSWVFGGGRAEDVSAAYAMYCR